MLVRKYQLVPYLIDVVKILFFNSYTKIVVKGMTRAEHILKVMYKLIQKEF